MTILKKIEIFAPAVALLPKVPADIYNKQVEGIAISEEEKYLLESETKKLIDGFGVESLTDSVELSITIEDFLYGLFSQLPKPTTPLKIAAHDRWIQKIAGKLMETYGHETDLPNIDKEDLNKVRHFIEDDAEFQKQSAGFSFINKKTNETNALNLSALILTSSSGFVMALDKLFN